jgi:pilus assembly protein CpaE
MADLKAYPAEQTLDIRIRQLNPDVVLLDVCSDIERAFEVVDHLTRVRFDISVVAIDRESRPETLLKVLRAGASEYLYAPFDRDSTAEAVTRLLRLRKPDPARETEVGTLVTFSSAKPGSGASTLALQTAFALQRGSGKRVLLIDLDLTGGTIGFQLKLDTNISIVDAMIQADRLHPSFWTSLITTCDGLDVLPAPAMPVDVGLEPGRLQMVLDYARTMYDWIITDLPTVFQRTSLIAISQSDRTMLVSTCELPSLHLARRAVGILDQLGFPKERFQVVVNRVEKRTNIKTADLAKLFNCPVNFSLPNDYFSLHRVVTLGRPLDTDGELGRAIESMAARVANAAAIPKRPEIAGQTGVESNVS